MATPPSSSDMSPIVPPATGANAAQNQRYVYLVSRLRNRQMTMEEATELFGMMQGMLRTSELARQAALRAMAAPPPKGMAQAPKAAAAEPSGAGIPPDDLLMLGLLGTGAAAGVLAAITKRLQEVTQAPGPKAAPPKSQAPPS